MRGLEARQGCHALIIYLFLMITVVISVGRAIYVLPTLGPLGADALAVAMVPALAIVTLLCLAIGAIWDFAFPAALIVANLRRK